MDPVHSGTGVFYQAMPAVGADGKNIMKLIPVQMVNGHFVQTEINKPRLAPTAQKAVTLNFSSAPVQMVKKADLNPSATQQIVKKQVSFVNVLPKPAGFDLANSLNKHPPQQKQNVKAKLPLIAPATNCGKLVTLPCQLPVTMKSPALPSGQYFQIRPNAQVPTVQASDLSELIKKQIFTSSASSSPGPGLPSVVFMSPVTTVNQGVTNEGVMNQGVTPPCDSALPSLNLLSKTLCGLPAKSKTLLKLVPKVSQRPNSPIKWVIEEEHSSAAPNINLHDPSSVASEILRTVAERENTSKHSDNIRKSTQSNQGKSGQGERNTVVVCNGRVIYVAKKGSRPFKMQKRNSPQASTETYESNKTSVPSTQESLQSDAAQTWQDLRIIIPDESDEVIDLCGDDDAQDDSPAQAASVNVSAVSLQDDDNVIFVSYIPPKSKAGSTQGLRLKTPTALARRATDKTGTSSLDSVTEAKRLDGGSDGRGVCGSVVMNRHDNEGSNTMSQRSTSTQQVQRMEVHEETESPVDPSTSNSSSGTRPQEQDTHKMESRPGPAPCRTPSPAAKPCQMEDHQLRQIFGITSEVKICLQKIDEDTAMSSELFLQELHSSCKKQQTDTYSCLINVKSALSKLETKPPSALTNKCHLDKSSLKGASCDDENAPVIGYVEPIDEDFPSADGNVIHGSQNPAAQLQTQTCEDLNTNTRRIGRARKRTMCPCCVPGSLEPAVKSSARLDEPEKLAWMTESMSKKGGRTKAPRKDGKTSGINCLTAKNEVPSSDSLTTSLDFNELKRHKQIKRLKQHLEKEVPLELMSDS
ncbi:ligand-dependent nuclear receptor-interacting factor 1 [Seriola aureovittata]|uniref:ligand-dependent nuclear receptor-interacting factor 1 n=1 Tax=Seriola aureovittata TaxID=2871759 RepID=UPI0024BE228B|nr:ligand-dependent nuclear receptor-interacting factor 1 [Seriola aureovittata]